MTPTTYHQGGQNCHKTTTKIVNTHTILTAHNFMRINQKDSKWIPCKFCLAHPSVLGLGIIVSEHIFWSNSQPIHFFNMFLHHAKIRQMHSNLWRSFSSDFQTLFSEIDAFNETKRDAIWLYSWLTPMKTDISPENWWLEDVKMVPFQGTFVQRVTCIAFDCAKNGSCLKNPHFSHFSCSAIRRKEQFFRQHLEKYLAK